MKGTILIVEDHQDLAATLKIQLEENDYAVEHAADGEIGLSMALEKDYSMVLLDITLPKKNGLEVLKEIRKTRPKLPVMMLSSKSEDIDKVVGLNLGADDYLTKPFTVSELLARVNALLRRAGTGAEDKSSGSTEPGVLLLGKMKIDTRSRSVLVKGEKVTLRPKEYEVLFLLASHPGRAFSREELIEEIWEYDGGDYAQSVNNTIAQLRKKIESSPAEPQYILTVHGYGYRFAKEDELQRR